MKAKRRNLMLAGLLLSLSTATCGILLQKDVTATAAATPPSVSMLVGAATRKDANLGGLKFTANISDYAADYQYGMLILPEQAWSMFTFNDDYISVLDAAGKEYSNKICTPYEDNGQWQISCSLVDILEENYSRNFVGVAYTLQGNVYDYADVNLYDNSRSVSYVAQMALEFTDGLTGAQKANLEKYANPDDTLIDLDKVADGVDGENMEFNNALSVKANHAVSIDMDRLNENAPATFITKKAYAGGSTVTFDAYVPLANKWWGICWTTDASNIGLYKWTTNEGGTGTTFTSKVGEWASYTTTLPDDGKNYYIYIVGSKGEWGQDAKNPLLIDNFQIGEEKDAFDASLTGGMFDVNGDAVTWNKLDDAYYEIGSQPVPVVDKALAMDLSVQGEKPRVVTKNTYAAGSTVSFSYYVASGTTAGWARFITTSNSGTDIYGGTWTAFDVATKGEWLTFTGTVANNGEYIAIGTEAGKAGTLYIDDFMVNGELVEDFNGDMSTWNIAVDNSEHNVCSQVSLPADKPVVEEPEEGITVDSALKLTIASQGESAKIISKNEYTSGSVVSFSYYITDHSQGWANLKCSTSNTNISIYDAAITSIDITTKNQWATCTATLSQNGYLVIVTAQDQPKDGYLYIDDFKVNGELVEDFNGAMNEWAINADTVACSQSTLPADKPVVGDSALKIDLSNGNEDVRMITKNMYAANSLVTYSYYFTDNATIAWGGAFNTTNLSCDIYGAASTSIWSNGYVKGKWQTGMYTTTADGYIAISTEAGKQGYLYIDDLKVNGELVEDFNGDLSTWSVNVYAKACSQDAIPTEKSAGNAMGIVGNAIGGNERVAVVTKDAYRNIKEISFDANWLLSGLNTDNYRWGLSLTENKGNYNYYTSSPLPHLAMITGWYNYKYVITDNQLEVFFKAAGDAEYTSMGTCAFDASKAYYLYIQIAPGGDINVAEPILAIDNVIISTTTSVGYDSFEDGATAGLFEEAMTTNGLTATEGAKLSVEIPEVPVAPTDIYSLADLIAWNKIDEFLTSGGYASFASTKVLNLSGLPLNTLALFGSISYEITGEKEFAIVIGTKDGEVNFLYVNGTQVAFYNGVTLCGSTTISGELNFSIAVNGRVYVQNTNGDYVCLGTAAAVDGFKVVGLGGTGSVRFNDIVAKTYEVIGENVPVYVSADQIDFTAYSPLSNATMTDSTFKLLADAGFTKGLGLLEGRVGLSEDMTAEQIDAKMEALLAQVEADANTVLSLAEKYEIEYYVFNELLYNIHRYDNVNASEYTKKLLEAMSYSNSKAYAGHFLADEPNADELTELIAVVDTYLQYGAEPYINLLPYEGTNSWFSWTSWGKYEEYIENYITNIGSKLGYISYDHYAFGASTGDISDEHLQNLEYVARKAKEANLEVRAFIWASVNGSDKHRAITSVNDFRFQINSHLCFGVVEMPYFIVTGNTDNDTETSGLINGATGVESSIYAYAKQANNEAHALEDAYLNFTWDSYYKIGSCTEFSNIKGTSTKADRIATVSSSASVLIGNFKDSDNKYTYGAADGFMVMNYADPSTTSGISDVTITFNNATRAIVYLNGEMSIVSLNSGTYTLSLAAGNGAFIIPLTETK